MKRTIIILVVIALCVAGYIFFVQKPAAETPADSASQGKINIDEVCEGALVYMTFPDGASAEAFVAECKKGNRPEVIERYKAEMNLGDGAEL